MLVILLVGLVWGGYTTYARLRPPEGFLVLIADFDGSNATRKGDFAGRIGTELIGELRDVSDAVTVERSLETYTDSEAAQAAGRKRKAAMVIWGTYDDFGVTPRVELLRQPLLAGGDDPAATRAQRRRAGYGRSCGRGQPCPAWAMSPI